MEVELKEKESIDADAAVPGSERRSRFDGFATRKRDWGMRRAIYWQVMHTLVRTIGLRLHRIEVSAERRDLWDPNPPEVPAGYTTKICTKADLQPFVDTVPDFPPQFFKAAFDRGDDCSASFYEGKLVAFTFNSRSRTLANDQIDVLIPEGFRYGYKTWTHQDHRRRNLSRMLGYVLQQGANRPYEERGIWIVETHNFASRLHTYRHPRNRSILVGYGGWFSFFGRHIPFNSRGAKWIGLEFVRKSDNRVRYYSP